MGFLVQASGRGNTIDVFSYSNEHPYRLILDGDIVDEITSFKVSNQISIEKLNSIEIISNIEYKVDNVDQTTLFSYLPKNTIIWIYNAKLLFENTISRTENNCLNTQMLEKVILNYHCVYTGSFSQKNHNIRVLTEGSFPI